MMLLFQICCISQLVKVVAPPQYILPAVPISSNSGPRIIVLDWGPVDALITTRGTCNQLRTEALLLSAACES